MSDALNQTEGQEPQNQDGQKEYWPMVNVRMPPECVQQLKGYAEKHFVGVSAAVRMALLQAGVITAPEAQNKA